MDYSTVDDSEEVSLSATRYEGKIVIQMCSDDGRKNIEVKVDPKWAYYFGRYMADIAFEEVQRKPKC